MEAHIKKKNVVVDIGIGNIKAFLNIFKDLNICVETASKKEQLISASKIILPGVGSFDWAMRHLKNSGLLPILMEKIQAEKTPFLGICVGMQILGFGSEEGAENGLGWIPGSTKKFSFLQLNKKLPIPHMGWNSVTPQKESSLFYKIQKPEYYFLHSYYFSPCEEENILATSEYGIKFASAIQKGNVSGVQFHPEKSHDFGRQLLKNFLLN